MFSKKTCIFYKKNNSGKNSCTTYEPIDFTQYKVRERKWDNKTSVLQGVTVTGTRRFIWIISNSSIFIAEFWSSFSLNLHLRWGLSNWNRICFVPRSQILEKIKWYNNDWIFWFKPHTFCVAIQDIKGWICPLLWQFRPGSIWYKI